MTLTATKNLLGYNISALSFEEIIEFILKKLHSNQGAHIVTINPEIIELANQNETFKKIISNADLLIPDGFGIVLGFKLKGVQIQRTPGIEISEKLIEIANKENFKIGLLGASQEVIELTKTNIQSKYPDINITFCHNGYFKEQDAAKLIEEIKKSNTQILFVGMGMLKQETFINNYKNELNRTIMIGVGGSFDVWANKTQRAPKAYQNFGLEWLYRLLKQPSRFSRMFPTLPIFLLKVIHSILKGDKS